jgi:hypothetical protein
MESAGNFGNPSIPPYVRIVVTPKISKIRGADRIKKWLIHKNVKKQYLKNYYRLSTNQ